jgi:hypothetical protein
LFSAKALLVESPYPSQKPTLSPTYPAGAPTPNPASTPTPTSVPTIPTGTPTSVPTIPTATVSLIPTGTPTSVPTVTVAPTSTTIISYIFYCDKQEPQIIVTEGESCSSYIHTYPQGSTCLSPTASPTIPPTSNDAVQLGVSQTINNCSYTNDYLVAPGLYDKTFRQAIITSLQPSIPSIDGSSIIDFLVSPPSTAVAATSIRSRKLQTPSVVISYTLQSASVSTATLSSALNTAVSNGYFDTNLHTIADDAGISGLATATSSTPVIVNNSPTFSPTYTPGAPTLQPTLQPTVNRVKSTKSNSTAIIASIVAVVVFLIGIAGAWYYRYTLKKKSTTQISVDANTNNPMANRISVMDGKMPITDSEINLSPVKKTGSN